MRDGLGRLQRVVLLGGTSDIGLAIVSRLVATRGVAEVVLAGRDAGRMRMAADDLAATDDPAAAGRVSVAIRALDATDDPAVIDAAVGDAIGDGCDVVVHAVGMLPHDDRSGNDPGLAARVFDVNTTGSGVMLLAAARRLRASGHGTLVALSSVAAVRARPDNLVYGAAKAGYDALAVGLADQLAGSGAGVLVVRPGFVHTSMTETHDEAPLAVQPTEVAEAVDHALDGAGRAWGRRIVWVPAAMRVVAAGIRLAPGPVLAGAAERMGRSDESAGT